MSNSASKKLCVICDEPCERKNCVAFQNCTSRHWFCASCVETYITAKIKEGITDIKCLHFNCAGLISEVEIARNVKQVVLNKFIRFKVMKNDPTYRECHYCDHRLYFKYSSSIVCASCGVRSCFHHGGAHPNRSCEQYVKDCAHQIESELEIQRTSQKCPSCGVYTQKNGGCDHMHCTQCRRDWTWYPLPPVIDAPPPVALPTATGPNTNTFQHLNETIQRISFVGGVDAAAAPEIAPVAALTADLRGKNFALDAMVTVVMALFVVVGIVCGLVAMTLY